MSEREDGERGQEWARLWLSEQPGVRVRMQIDWLVQWNDQPVSVEVKHQDIFEPPPFWGHGLPKWQIDERLSLQEEKGIRALFLVFDKSNDQVFWQFIDQLESGPHYDTRGTRPRRIYPIESFNQETWIRPGQQLSMS